MGCARNQKHEASETLWAWIMEVDWITRPDIIYPTYVKKDKELPKRDIPEYKVCRLCKMERPADAFAKAPTNKDGLQSLCKDCAKSERKKYN